MFEFKKFTKSDVEIFAEGKMAGYLIIVKEGAC